MEAIETENTEFIIDAIQKVAEDLLLWGAIGLGLAWLMRRSDRMEKARRIAESVGR